MTGAVVDAAAFLVGVVLLAAGVPKAYSANKFAEQIADYEVLPPRAAGAAARVVSSVELVSGALLLVGLSGVPVLREIGAGLAALLFAAFLAVLTIALAKGRAVPCACFGGSGELETIGRHSQVRAALLLGLAMLATLHTGPDLSVAALGLAALLAALVALISEMARLLGPSRAATATILSHLEQASEAVIAREATA